MQLVRDPTHRSGNILDHVICRSCDHFVSSVSVDPAAAFSDHFPVRFDVDLKPGSVPRQTIKCRNYKKLDISALAGDLRSNVDISSAASVDEKFHSFSNAVRRTFDAHVPLKARSVSLRKSDPWMCNGIFRARTARRQAERAWRRTGLEVHRQIYRAHRIDVLQQVNSARTQYLSDSIAGCQEDQRKLFGIVHALLDSKAGKDKLPLHDNKPELAAAFSNFFDDKIKKINLQLSSTPRDFGHIVPDMCKLDNDSKLMNFRPATQEEIHGIIKDSSSATCSLDDLPTKLLKNDEIISSLLPDITDIINSSLKSGTVPSAMKSAIIRPLLKKSNLDSENMKNYRPISNLSFISKILERIVAVRI